MAIGDSDINDDFRTEDSDEDMRPSGADTLRTKGLPKSKIRSPKMLKMTKNEIRAPRQRKMRTNYRNA